MTYLRGKNNSTIPEKVMTPLFKNNAELFRFMNLLKEHSNTWGELPYLDYCKYAGIRVDPFLNSMMQYHLIIDTPEPEYIHNAMGYACKFPIVRRRLRTDLAVAPACFGEA